MTSRGAFMGRFPAAIGLAAALGLALVSPGRTYGAEPPTAIAKPVARAGVLLGPWRRETRPAGPPEMGARRGVRVRVSLRTKRRLPGVARNADFC